LVRNFDADEFFEKALGEPAAENIIEESRKKRGENGDEDNGENILGKRNCRNEKGVGLKGEKRGAEKDAGEHAEEAVGRDERLELRVEAGKKTVQRLEAEDEEQNDGNAGNGRDQKLLLLQLGSKKKEKRRIKRDAYCRLSIAGQDGHGEVQPWAGGTAVGQAYFSNLPQQQVHELLPNVHVAKNEYQQFE